MDFKLGLLIFKNRSKLSKLIEQNAEPEKILKQSKLLDKYIAQGMNLEFSNPFFKSSFLSFYLHNFVLCKYFYITFEFRPYLLYQ